MTDKLFFDTDCISAFLWVKEENILFKLYPGKIILHKLEGARADSQRTRL